MWLRVCWCVMLCLVQRGSAVEEYLLPGHVVPHNYDLRLLYDLDPATNFSYYAVVDILISLKLPTSRIVLHGQGFSVNKDKTTLRDAEQTYPIENLEISDTYNFLTIVLSTSLLTDRNYTLTIPFYGNLKKELDGVYISTYVNKMAASPTEEYLIATQFEAISARKGFPCFDEPVYKATFSVNIGHGTEFSAVSNMPMYNSSKNSPMEDYWSWQEISKTFKKDKSSFIWDQFEKSVPMSTYLLAYLVSKFGYVDSPADLSTTKFQIWARKDAIKQTSYASTVGPRVLTTFEKWFNVPFPLPKQDMAAIPDFSAGAMENWGLITYRETALLYDETQSSFMAKERVASVIAHELAHQWFGNLVTMKWWSDLWLNEGFATFVASLGVRSVEPTWKSDEGDAVSNMRSVLSLDALENSHPVSVPINNPNRISEIFDEISYKKGATIIRMMTMFLGEDVFRKAINRYLVKYSYQNAEQDDLWHELTQVTQLYNVLSRNVTVKEIMDTWTTQTGYPILTVNRDYTDGSLTVMQKRFLNLGAKAKTAVSWWIPLNVLCQNEVGKRRLEPIQWLSNKEGTVQEHQFDHGAANDEWVLFNADMIAICRVNYDHRNWNLLINTLNSKDYGNIPVLSRVQLLEDAFALAWSSVIQYTTAFQLANYLSRETEYLPLETGLAALTKIENVLDRSPDYGAFQKFVRKLITKSYESAGGLYERTIINPEDLNSVKLQVLTSKWACRMKVPGCEENAIGLFREWMEVANPDEENPIPLDLRGIVYCIAMSRGSVEEWRFLFQRYQNANVASAKTSAMISLSCTKEVWILQQFLSWSIGSGQEVRRQDAGSVISAIAHSTVGFYLAKDFLYNRMPDIYEAFNGQSRRLGHIVRSVVEQFTRQQELDEFLAWRDKNTKYLEGANLAVSQAIEKAQVNIDWLNRNGKIVVESMRANSK